MSGLPLRPFGAGPWCSVLTLGTAALARPYAGGFPPDPDYALALIGQAIDRFGVNLLDTAPAYGSEGLVGIAAARWPHVMVATKLTTDGGTGIPVWRQIEHSRSALQRDRIDLVQIHNATVWTFRDGRAMNDLHEARSKGWIRMIGASVYTAPEASEAIRAGVDVLQVPYNLLDQRMRTLGVLTRAQKAGVGVLARSVWLRGALAACDADVPPVVRVAAWRTRMRLLASRETFPSLALRFALQSPVASVVIGPRTVDELDQAYRAAIAGPLPWWRAGLASGCQKYATETIMDPRTWA